MPEMLCTHWEKIMGTFWGKICIFPKSSQNLYFFSTSAVTHFEKLLGNVPIIFSSAWMQAL